MMRRVAATAVLAMSACVQPLTLEPPPETPAYASAVGVVVRNQVVVRALGYGDPPPLDRIVLEPDQELYLFFFDRDLESLGLELPLRVAASGDPQAVPLPAAQLGLGLEIGSTARWVTLDGRPGVVDDLRLRGVTAISCAERGGCFPTAADRERLQCAFDCAERIAFEVAPPTLPDLGAERSCRAGWSSADRSFELDPLLEDLTDRVRVRTCGLPVSDDCGTDAMQAALDEACRPLAECSAVSQLSALPAGAPVVYVPAAVAGGPEGLVFASVAAADAGALADAVVVLGAGRFTVPPALDRVAALVGRCPAETALDFAGAIPSGLDIARVRLEPPPGGLIAGPIRSSRIALRGALSVSGTRLEDVRIDGAAPVEAVVASLGDGAALERVMITEGVSLRIDDEAEVSFREVRLSARPGSAPLRVEGALDATDFALTVTAPTRISVEEGGRWDGRGVDLGSAPGARLEDETVVEVEGTLELRESRMRGAELDVVGGEAELRFEDGGIGEPTRFRTVALRARDGASVWLRRVASERATMWVRRGTAELADWIATGDPLERVDPRDGLEIDVGTDFVALKTEDARVSVDRAVFVDAPSVLAARPGSDVTLRDVVVSRSRCEPFALGPGPVRAGLDLDVRDARRCQRMLYPAGEYDYPHPPEEYGQPLRAELQRVWVRSAGLAEPFRTELQAAGTVELDVEDLRFLRTTSRGLLMQGDVRFDVRRAIFENPGVQGACFFPAVRLEPTPDLGFGPRAPTGALDGILSDGMDVGLIELLGADFEPRFTVRNMTIRDAFRGIVRARASDRTFAVPIDLADFVVANVFVDVESLQGATANESCD